MEKNFQFQALNQDGRIVSGTVTGQTEEDARGKLSAKGLAVLSIEERKGNAQIPIGASKPEEVQQSTGTIYEFKCQDSEGKPAVGTIQEEAIYDAYKKLRNQYEKVVYMVPKDASPNEKKLMRFNGLDPALEERYQEELKQKSPKKEKKEEKTQDEEVNELVESKEKELELFRVEIEDVVEKVNGMLQDKSHLLKPEKIREITKDLDLLIRLKRSNAIDHLKALTYKILDELASEDVFIEDMDLPQDILDSYKNQQEEFKKNVKQHVKHFNHRIRRIQLKLGGLDPESLKKTFRKLKKFQIAENILTVVYWTFAILAVYFAIFWLFNIGKYFLGISAEKIHFYFQSGALWYFTIVSASIAYYFGWFHFRPNRLQWYHMAIFFVAFMLFSLEFPAIMSWM